MRAASPAIPPIVPPAIAPMFGFDEGAFVDAAGLAGWVVELGDTLPITETVLLADVDVDFELEVEEEAEDEE
jgi:hypothetical protein